jgi:hypothetical protein
MGSDQSKGSSLPSSRPVKRGGGSSGAASAGTLAGGNGRAATAPSPHNAPLLIPAREYARQRTRPATVTGAGACGAPAPVLACAACAVPPAFRVVGTGRAFI